MNPRLRHGRPRPANGLDDISLLVVEDDELIRDSLLEWLRSILPQGHVIGAPSEQVTKVAAADEPDAIIVDLSSSAGDQLGLVRRLTRLFPEAELVALTLNGDYEARDAVLAAGASACLPLWTLSDRLQRILHQLLGEEPRR
jgi:DNA-binding NarL/FixJ family response regulator